MVRLVCHCLLMLMLVLNGVGSAAAGVRMAVSVPVDNVATHARASSHHAAADNTDAAASHADCTKDCCKTHLPNCAQSCAQGAQAVFSTQLLMMQQCFQAAIESELEQGHPRPPLTEKHRPPIV